MSVRLFVSWSGSQAQKVVKLSSNILILLSFNYCSLKYWNSGIFFFFSLSVCPPPLSLSLSFFLSFFISFFLHITLKMRHMINND